MPLVLFGATLTQGDTSYINNNPRIVYKVFNWADDWNNQHKRWCTIFEDEVECVLYY